MDNCLHQTYLWLAFQQAISQNQITPLKFRLQQILLKIMEQKVTALISEIKKTSTKKSRTKNLLTAEQVMYNQFEVGPKQVPKYRCVLYHMSCPQQLKMYIKVKSNHVAMVELYSDALPSNKKIKSQVSAILVNTEKQPAVAKKSQLKRPPNISPQKKCKKRKKLE